MKPIPETAAFFKEFGAFYEIEVLDELERQAGLVRVLVPDLVGVSLGCMRDGVTFTLVATTLDVAILDAVQYFADGPCEVAPRVERVVEFNGADVDDEQRWHAFARATAARAVATTLTLPVMDEDRVVGSVNLYAAAAGAFTGLHDEVADIFRAWAPGAVTNADLSFETRRTAERAREAMRASLRVDIAVGLLMSERSIDADAAAELLEDAAVRAGVPIREVAEAVLEVFESRRGPDEVER